MVMASLIKLVNRIFSGKFSDFENEALEVHNEYRRDHGVAPLTLSKEICEAAQKWAEELAKQDRMAYSLTKEYGENIYCGWSPDSNTKVTARDCVEKWFSGTNNHSFGKEPEILTFGHFTQILWKDTKELGIGSAKSKSGKFYVVANYYPRGNYSGQLLKKFPKFEKECLDAHNAYRRKHGVPPLVLNKNISKYSEEWAKELVRRQVMVHRDQDTYGENIFFAWSSDPNFILTGKDPVDSWYSEIKDHTFGEEPTTSFESGHFTQVIWKDTKEVGVGVVKSENGVIFVVANYLPPGNVFGSFATHVPLPIDK